MRVERSPRRIGPHRPPGRAGARVHTDALTRQRDADGRASARRFPQFNGLAAVARDRRRIETRCPCVTSASIRTSRIRPSADSVAQARTARRPVMPPHATTESRSCRPVALERVGRATRCGRCCHRRFSAPETGDLRRGVALPVADRHQAGAAQRGHKQGRRNPAPHRVATVKKSRLAATHNDAMRPPDEPTGTSPGSTRSPSAISLRFARKRPLKME